MKTEQDSKPQPLRRLRAVIGFTAAGVKEMWGDWHGRLLLVCGLALIPGAILVAVLIHPAYVLLWVNGLTAIMLLGRCVWRSRR